MLWGGFSLIIYIFDRDWHGDVDCIGDTDGDGKLKRLLVNFLFCCQASVFGPGEVVVVSRYSSHRAAFGGGCRRHTPSEWVGH